VASTSPRHTSAREEIFSNVKDEIPIGSGIWSVAGLPSPSTST
jgi:hypothetical protein